MKKKILFGIAAVTVTVATIVACKRTVDQKFDARPTAASERIPSCEACDSLGTVTLTGVINANRQLSCDTVYVIDGKVYVSNNATLTIAPGTVLKGKSYPNPANASALIITKGAKIDARGTQTCPIIFTSDKGDASARPGDWGGVVLLGDAPTNKPTTTIIEGINQPSVPAGVDITYGGTDATDNSGVMTYCRIEFAGASIAQDNELNGLTCGGVGSNTVLDFIEVYRGNDDAFEFFGGTVNAKHLIAFEPDDDAFDFDFGYTGCIQFAVSVLSDDTSTYSANPNGIESDNDGIPSCTTPKTNPKLSNLTVVGVGTSAKAGTLGLLNGAFFRRNSLHTVANSIFMGFPNGARVDANACGDACQYFQKNIVHGFTTALNTPAACNYAAVNTTLTGANPNSTILLANPFNAAAYDFRPVSGSPALSDTSFAASSCWTKVGYRGAFASGSGNNWMFGWAKIPTTN